MDKMCGPTMRQQMANYIQNSTDCQRILDELRKSESFLNEFDSLTIGKYYSYFTAENKFVALSPARITRSIILTMGSIISCCESGCIADANILLRKYRDDLFFLLYISYYYDQDGDSERINRIKCKIDEWANNGLEYLNIGTILGDIASV